jgi:hypothetical protein
MRDQQDGTPKPRVMITIAAVVLAFAVIAYIGHRATVSHVVETLYGQILASPPPRLGDYPV